MKIKEALGSARELESQLRKISGNNNDGSQPKSGSVSPMDAVRVQDDLVTEANRRAERVKQIKESVQSGEYRTKSEDIAKSLLRDLF